MLHCLITALNFSQEDNSLYIFSLFFSQHLLKIFNFLASKNLNNM